MLEDNKSISDKEKFDRLQYLADSINSSISVPLGNPKKSEASRMIKGGLVFTSKECEVLDDRAACTVAVSNLSKKEARIAIFNQAEAHFSSLVSANGDQRIPQELHFGSFSSSGNGFVEQLIPSGLTINARFVFDESSENFFPCRA